jgi:hypothetical protein
MRHRLRKNSTHGGMIVPITASDNTSVGGQSNVYLFRLSTASDRNTRTSAPNRSQPLHQVCAVAQKIEKGADRPPQGPAPIKR